MSGNELTEPRFCKGIMQQRRYDDWKVGARGPGWREKTRFAVDRIRRLTKGGAEVVLITTCSSPTGLADVAAAIHKQGGDEAKRLLGEAGHRLEPTSA